jgi:outer membrane immunogenic protein
MKKLTIAAAAVAFAGTAQAADLYVKAPPVTVYDWSGIYVGANAGYGFADETWALPGNPVQFFNPFVTTGAFATHPKGALAGGQIGINKQVGNWVWGAEVTGDWSDLHQAVTGPFAVPGFETDVWTTKLHDLETLTARLGYAFNNVLVYGKAGGATGVVSVAAVSGPSAFPFNGATFSQSQRLWGTTVGAGVEYGLTPNWVIGVEYDFTRLFPGQFSGNAFLPGVGTTPVSIGTASSFDVQTVVGRVSYKF